MKFKINYTIKGNDDSVIVEGDTIEECREKAHIETKKRGATNVWSEEVK